MHILSEMGYMATSDYEEIFAKVVCARDLDDHPVDAAKNLYIDLFYGQNEVSSESTRNFILALNNIYGKNVAGKGDSKG
jgi:hypothetical protein